MFLDYPEINLRIHSMSRDELPHRDGHKSQPHGEGWIWWENTCMFSPSHVSWWWIYPLSKWERRPLSAQALARGRTGFPETSSSAHPVLSHQGRGNGNKEQSSTSQEKWLTNLPETTTNHSWSYHLKRKQKENNVQTWSILGI